MQIIIASSGAGAMARASAKGPSISFSIYTTCSDIVLICGAVVKVVVVVAATMPIKEKRQPKRDTVCRRKMYSARRQPSNYGCSTRIHIVIYPCIAKSNRYDAQGRNLVSFFETMGRTSPSQLTIQWAHMSQTLSR